MRQKQILGVRVDFGLRAGDVVNVVDQLMLKDDGPHYICTTNPEFIMSAQSDSEFREIINKSTLSVPDGVGVVLADKYMEAVLPYKKDNFFPRRLLKSFITGTAVGVKTIFCNYNSERVTGVELVDRLCDLASEKNLSVFLLGGWPKDWTGKDLSSLELVEDYATVAAQKIEQRCPNIKIIGSTSKYSSNVKDDLATLDYMHECMKKHNVNNIDLLFVAYSFNKQEKWIKRNSNKIPAKVSIGVGGTFDYIVGHSRKVSPIMSQLGLEWLFRLLNQPFRIGRIINAFPLFPFKVFIDSLK